MPRMCVGALAALWAFLLGLKILCKQKKAHFRGIKPEVIKSYYIGESNIHYYREIPPTTRGH